jgi:homocysteine S-methyltransferase
MEGGGLRALLASQKVVISDGGLATELENRGANLADHLWSARLLRDDPQLIYETHLGYYLAGADLGTSASYQATIGGFEKAGIEAAEGERLIRSSVSLVRAARDAAWEKIQADAAESEGGERERSARARPLVAASVGAYGASLADGSEYRGDYKISLEELKDFHRNRMMLLAQEHPDVFACETVPCLLEVEALLQLMEEAEFVAAGIPAWIVVTCKDAGHLCSGEPLSKFADLVNSYLVKGDAMLSAIGINCSPPQVCGIYTHTHTHTHTHACMHANIHTHSLSHTHTYINAYLQTIQYIHTHIHIHTYIRMYHNLDIFTTDHISLMFCRKQMFLHIRCFNNSTALTNII